MEKGLEKRSKPSSFNLIRRRQLITEQTRHGHVPLFPPDLLSYKDMETPLVRLGVRERQLIRHARGIRSLAGGRRTGNSSGTTLHAAEIPCPQPVSSRGR